MKLWKWLASVVTVAGLGHVAFATDLAIHLPTGVPISRKIVHYQCDGNATKIGAPAGPFAVEYINAGGNSLAIVPVAADTIIFSNVTAASGARYSARQFTWWEAKGIATLYTGSPASKLQSECHPVRTK